MIQSRLLAAAGVASVVGCATADGQVAAVSDLSVIARDPLQFDGQRFRGYDYLQRAENVYEFGAAPNDNEGTVSFLAGDGDNSPSLRDVSDMHPGDRLQIEAVIDVMTECFGEEYLCAPWPRPVFLSNVRVLEHDKND